MSTNPKEQKEVKSAEKPDPEAVGIKATRERTSKDRETKLAKAREAESEESESDESEEEWEPPEDWEDYEDGGYKIVWQPYGEEMWRISGILPKEQFQLRKYICGCQWPLIPWGNEHYSRECIAHLKMAWAMKKEQMKKDKARKELEADWKAYGDYTVDDEGTKTFACGCVFAENAKEPDVACARHAGKA